MRTLYILIAFTIFASPVWCDNTVGGEDMPWEEEDEAVPYDFNDDGKVDILDITILISKYNVTLTDEEKQTLDVNKDNTIDANDVTALKDIILEISKK